MYIHDHLLSEATYIPSPNFNERPLAMAIEMIVIHNISLPPGEFGNHYIKDFFTNCLDFSAHTYFSTIQSLKVSAHLVIYRDGNIQQFVPFDKRAWHAGVSSYQGRENCGDFSIGIELEGTDDKPFTELQYQQLLIIIPSLLCHYPTIRRDWIVGHQHIAPQRKTDPGPYFDWKRLQDLL